MDKVAKYFEKNIAFNSFVHLVAGVGFGALFVHTVFDPHPIRYSAFFIIMAALGYWYAYDNFKPSKKK